MNMNLNLSKYFSLTASQDWIYRYSFIAAGLRPVSTDLGEGTVMHCWIPKYRGTSKPNLVLVHGFGANAMWQYDDHLRHFTSNYNVYVPDLVFFGRSFTSRRDRTEAFQAQCVTSLMDAHGVHKMSVVGISYGGFVGYSMAAQSPRRIEKLVLCCARVCLEEKDMEAGLFRVSDLGGATSILLPQTPEKLKELIRFSFVRPTKGLLSWFLSDFIHVMCRDFLEEKRQLIQAILKGREYSDLPKITQPTLIIWGEQDQIFPLELGYRLKRHVGESAKLVVIKNAGHAVNNLEKSKEFIKHFEAFPI